MSALALLAAAVAWVAAYRSRDALVARGAGALHLSAAILTVVLRGMTGWASILVLATSAPALLRFSGDDEGPPRIHSLALAVLAALGAACAAAAPGPGVTLWMVWGIPHIALATLGVAAALIGGVLALHRLRGRAVPLLLLALVLTALPLVGDRASAVSVYSAGEPATVQVELADPVGDQGVLRVLPARAPLPLERPLRWAVTLLLLAGLAFSGARAVADRSASPHPRWLVAVAIGAVSLHVLLLLSAMIPRELGVEPADLEAIASRTIALEAFGSERAGPMKLPAGPLTGGLGAPALPLTLALAALGLTLAAFLRPKHPPGPATRTLEARAVWIGALFLLGALSTGMAWSNFSWGALVVADPKLFALVIVLGLYVLYTFWIFVVPQQHDTASWLALAAALVLGWSMLGPDLGWVAPTLHSFGA